MAKRNHKSVVDQTIERIYYKHCSGMQISVMRIPELYRLAKLQLEGGMSEERVGEWMIAFVKGESTNAH